MNFYNLKRKEKNYMRQHNVQLALASKNSFLETSNEDEYSFKPFCRSSKK